MRTHVRTLLAVTVLGLSGAAWSEAPKPWMQAYYYQVEPLQKAADGAATVRIDYVRGRQVLHSTQVSLSADVKGLTTLVLPDPFTLAGAGGVDELQVLVYADESLIASFDLDSFRAYNRSLRDKDGDTLAQAFAAHAPDENAASAGIASAATAGATTNAASSCRDQCMSNYFRCMSSCSTPVNQCGRCAQEFDRCNNACGSLDSDADGVADSLDNCSAVFNPTQANCDGDAWGDACDSLNARYQAQPAHTCLVSKTEWFQQEVEFRHYAEWVEHDVSTCGAGAPDIWHRAVFGTWTCPILTGDFACCQNLAPSLTSFGGSTVPWCTTQLNIDYCHVH